LAASFISVQAAEFTHSAQTYSSASAAGSSVTTESLLLELTQVKLSKALPVLKQLEQVGGVNVLPLFKTMLAGELYFVKTSKQVVGYKKVNGDAVIEDPFTAEPLSDLTKKQIKKIRVNNRLRVYLRGVIARLQISHPDAEQRLSAVRSLLSDLDASTVATIQDARLSEENRDVQAMMDLA